MSPSHPVHAASLFAILRLSQIALAQTNWAQEGCYSSIGDLTNVDTLTWATYDTCGASCLSLGSAVGAMWNGGTCYCGDLLPPSTDKADDSECSTVCNGFGQQNCGGPNAFNVFLSGLNPDPGTQGAGSIATPSSSGTPAPSSSPSSQPPATSTVAKVTSVRTDVATSTQQRVITHDNTIVQTVAASTPSPAPTQDSDDSEETTPPQGGTPSGTKVGIAVGVIVGVVVLASIIAGTFVYLRRRKVKDEEKRHRRNESLRSFAGDKPRYALSDNRLDPSMMVERRNSDGSVFADNADYSRRILKVANPDES